MQQEPTIIIKPVEEINSAKTKDTIKANVNVAALQVDVSKMIEAKDGKIVIKCEDEDSRIKLKNGAIIALGNEYEVLFVETLKPKLKILRVKGMEEIEREELVKKIVEQINLISERDFKMKIVHTKYNDRFKDSTVIMEVDRKTHKLFVEKG